MGAFPVPVDVEQLVIAYLLANADVAPVFDTRIGTKAPAETDYPLVALHRFGGTPARQGWLKRPHVHFDVYGLTRAEAHDGAALVQSAIEELPGSYDLGVVTKVEELLDLLWLPDPNVLIGGEARPRFVFEETVFVRPHKQQP